MQAARRQHVEAVCTRPDVARFHFLNETGLRLDYARTHGGAGPLQRGPARPLFGPLSVYGLGAVQVLNGGR